MKTLTAEGEMCYVNVFRPDKPMNEGDEPQYKLSLIWHKDNDDVLEDLRDKILEVAEEKWGKKAGQMLKKGQLKSPIVDGDLKNADWLDDHWILTAKSTDKPGVVDVELDDIIDSTEVYPGAMGRMDIYLYPYDKRGNQGVGAVLNNVQKTQDGERKDGRQSAADAFGDDEDARSSKKSRSKKSRRSQQGDENDGSRRRGDENENEKKKKKKKKKKDK